MLQTNNFPNSNRGGEKKKFQVPKGMLQTKPAKALYLCRYCFKSPRECYKPVSGIWRRDTRYRFQVPKGMLQTPSGSTRSMSFTWVSSPQGNATNLIKAFEEKPEYYYVSSPQGNATNESHFKDRRRRRG